MEEKHPQQIPQRKIQTNKSIRMCPEVIAANFNDEKDLRKVSLE